MVINMSNFILENNNAALTLSDEGTVLSFTDKATGRDILAEAGKPFCYLLSSSGEITRPRTLSVGSDTLRFTFDKAELTLKWETDDGLFLFTVLTAPREEDCRSFRFAELKFDYDFPSKDAMAVSGYAMNTLLEPLAFPGGSEKRTGAACFPCVGAAGAKYAVITAPHEQQRGLIKKLNGMIPNGELPITAAGGANALDCKDNHGDYVIVTDSDPQRMAEWSEFYSRWSVDQLDFHHGEMTFRQGDFKFHKTGSAEGFRRLVAEPLRRAGITAGLHTYSFYIDYCAEGILTDPKWQEQLEVFCRLTLARDISAEDKLILPKEGMGDIPSEITFFTLGTNFILIDREIIRFRWTEEGFADCRRGWAGTAAVPHRAGAEIRHLSGYYGQLSPVIGSELFYHVARETARAYNEGGFGMFYLDALDGMYHHLKRRGDLDLLWYYTLTFVNEVVKHCERSPVMEYSTFFPALYPARGRGGAWDTPARNYKAWSDAHLASNRRLMDCLLTTTFGWFHFCPADEEYPGNFGVKYLHSDDVDYMGIQALCHDQSIVYNPLYPFMFDNFPALRRNMERYLRYNKLRKDGSVSDEVKARLMAGKHEWTSEETSEGVKFREAAYRKQKLCDLSRDAMTAVNPFGEQVPFIRVENHLSSVGEDPVTLLPLDAERPLREQTLSRTLDHLKLKDHLALRVTVLGNGSGDAVCIRLKGHDYGNNGVYDFVIRLNYTGLREFILAEPDNGDFADLVFPEKKEGGYEFSRERVNYDNLTSVEVYLSGDCTGVRMGDIEAVRHTERSLVDPIVEVNGSTAKFLCVLESTEYLEYTGGAGAVIYDRYGNAREAEAMVTSGFALPDGAFTATLRDSGDSPAPARATLTFGVYGETIG